MSPPVFSPRFFLFLACLPAPALWAQDTESPRFSAIPHFSSLPSALQADTEFGVASPFYGFSPRVTLHDLAPKSENPSAPALAGTPISSSVLKPPPNTFGQRPSEIYPHLVQIARAHPSRVQMRFFGKAASGADLVALEITPLRPMDSNRRLAVICRQHGNEPESTASGIRLIHQFLKPQTASQRAIAARTRLLIVPIANPDGAQIYERRTAQNIDMNRDWISRRSLEVRALVPLLARFQPHLLVDNHQWLPAQHQPAPMAETGNGSWAAMRAAKVMSSRSGARPGAPSQKLTAWGSGDFGTPILGWAR